MVAKNAQSDHTELAEETTTEIKEFTAPKATSKPASATEIMQALSPYITTGHGSLAVRIGTNDIVLKREQRNFKAPRNTTVDKLVDAAVNMSGPLSPEETEGLFKPYESKGITMKIDTDMVYFTAKPCVTPIRTHDGKIKNVAFKERTVSSSLDVPMAHIINVLNELTMGGDVFE